MKQPVEGGRFAHKLVRFSSAQLTRGVYAVDDRLVCAWVLGMVIDSNQSQNMVTVHVNVSLVRDIESSDDDGQIFTDTTGKSNSCTRRSSRTRGGRWRGATPTERSAPPSSSPPRDAPELRPDARSSKSADWH